MGRVTDHRLAMLRNQATALFRYEHIETTCEGEGDAAVRRAAINMRGGVDRAMATAEAACAAARGPRVVDGDVGVSSSTRSRRDSRSGPAATAHPQVGYRRGDSAEVAQLEWWQRDDPKRSRSRRSSGGAQEEGRGGDDARGRGRLRCRTTRGDVAEARKAPRAARTKAGAKPRPRRRRVERD